MNRSGATVEYIISPRFSKFKALAESQVTARPVELRGARLKTAKYNVPTVNSWGRSMPRVRVANMVHKAYVKLLDKIMPPLPEHEWKRLEGLVHGTVKWEGCKPRRKRLAENPDILTSVDLEKLVHLDDAQSERQYLDAAFTCQAADIQASKKAKILQAARDDSVRGYWSSADIWLDDPESINNVKEAVLRDELSIGRSLNKRAKGKERGHLITPRFMRRMWASIFQNCPMLNWNLERKVWLVTWGNGQVRGSNSSKETSRLIAPLFNVTSAMKKQSV